MKKLIVKTNLKSREAFDKRAAAIGLQFSPTIWQHERVYVPRDFRSGLCLPRLVMRTEVKKTNAPAEYALYLKRHIEDSGVDWVNYTPVGDYTEATAIVHQLGYHKIAEVSRQRQMVELDPKTVIYLDVVEGLTGSFLKIEAELMEDEPVELLRSGLLATLAEFGEETFLMQTYAELLNVPAQPYYLPSIVG